MKYILSLFILVIVQSGWTQTCTVTPAALSYSVCQNSSSALDISVNSTTATSFIWQVYSLGSWVNLPNGSASSYSIPTNNFNSPASLLYRSIGVVGGVNCDTSANITIQVLSNLTPTVSILSSDPDNSICSGIGVTFTATPTNGGVPSYQWKKNNVNISGATNSTYYTSSLLNNDVISCVMTANNSCQTANTATSAGITTSVIANVTPSVSISSSDPDNSICLGSNVIFTAAPVNGGVPSYQWKKNGTNVGTNSATYSSTSIANGDVITVLMSANNICQTVNTATSAGITTAVIAYVTPSVSISSSDQDNIICAGSNVTFTATPTNSGVMPFYQWKVNGSNVGTNSVSYTNANLNNGDLVSCQMTANNVCQTASIAISLAISTVVNQRPDFGNIPDVTICSGSPVNFNPASGIGATIPVGTSYTWTVSSVSELNETSNPIGVSGIQVLDNLTNTSNTVQSVVYTISGTSNNCSSLTPGILNVAVTPVVAQVSLNQTICQGTSVALFASGGSQYTWMEQGAPASSVNFPYISNPLASPNVNTQYSVLITDDLGCSTIRSVSINVQSKPVLNVIGNWSICSEEAMGIYLTSSITGSTYAWQAFPLGNLFNDALNGNSSTIDQTWTNEGLQAENVLYKIATIKNGCSSDTLEVMLQVKPNPLLTSDMNLLVCENESVVFAPEYWNPYTLNSWHRLTASNGSWSSSSQVTGVGDIDQVFSDLTQVSFVQYEIVGNLNGCISYDTLTLQISPKPTALVQTDFSVCEGNTLNIQLQDWEAAGYSVNWSSSSLFTPSNSANTIYLGEMSVQTAVSAINEFGCERQDMVNITILQSPSALFSGPQDLCEGVIGNWEAANPNYSVYEWYVDGLSQLLSSGVLEMSLDEGSHTIVLSIQDDNECSATMSKTVEVHSNPDPIIYGDILFCQKANDVMFSTMATPLTINWEVENAVILGGQGTSHLFVNLGEGSNSSIFISVQSTFGCMGYDTLSVSLGQGIADGPVQLGLIGNATITHPNSGFLYYNWGKTNISNGLESSQLMNVQYYNFGVIQVDQYYYWVETTNEDGCITRSYYNWPQYESAISEVYSKDDLQFFPNPVLDLLSFNSIVDCYEIFDQSGRIVDKGRSVKSVNVENLASGLYVMSALRNGKITRKQIIKF